MRLKKIFSGMFLCLVLASCHSTKDIVYFQNAKDLDTDVNVDTFEPKFKIGDILGIHVSTFDMEAASPFNLNVGGGNNDDSGSGSGLDYLIGKDGNIDFPVIGKVKLEGLTNEEAKQLLISKLKEYLRDPIVNIRIKNFRITVLGAVNNPGTYTVAGERITILEALGLAGDLHMQGMRNNILVIRDFNGTKTYTRLDITNKKITESPVFYLTQNDVIYVEPNESAKVAAVIDQRFGLGLSIVTTLISIATAVVVFAR